MTEVEGRIHSEIGRKTMIHRITMICGWLTSSMYMPHAWLLMELTVVSQVLYTSSFQFRLTDAPTEVKYTTSNSYYSAHGMNKI